ncbi:MAG: serine--tRNA ligase [Rhodospirillales bacterium CG15_BIG_FIL_POST_REV_8_21_14_020_66_15]|nr:MAG: serine--tRNA ligase [Rhodospirillales bacterium CG15_BIG_FIL_POST_REV_8_21_14_020_66_15]
MFDIKWIRENPDAFDAGLARRGLPPAAKGLLELDKQRRAAETRAQEIQTERNALSKQIGIAKSKGEDAADILAKVADSKDAQAAAEAEARDASAALDDALSGIPNLPAADVPDGADESANVEIRKWGEPKSFDFEPRDHVDLGEGLGLMDFENAAKLSGSRFVVLKGALARLERAIANFMLDTHVNEHGLTEVSPPTLVNDAAMYGTGQLPKFAEDLFHTDDGYWLIPTAEVPLTNLVAGEIADDDTLPFRFAALTDCYRSEAGAAGKDTRGMIRQHQFKKVEMVTVSAPETSDDELERMTGCAEAVLRKMGLPYRVIVLSTGDMGFGARKTYDIEIWLPGQGRYREISSCSNCGDFQARRMKARCRVRGEKGTRFVHTLNGSGVAVGRALVGVLENYQQADGSIAVPEVLRPYMGGLEAISREAIGKG